MSCKRLVDKLWLNEKESKIILNKQTIVRNFLGITWLQVYVNLKEVSCKRLYTQRNLKTSTLKRVLNDS